MNEIEQVQKRPGMYIGETSDGTNLVLGLVTIAVAEALAGHVGQIGVTLNADGSCTVRDNGRGIPTGLGDDEQSKAQALLTSHTTFSYADLALDVAGGCFCYLFVVNALSEWIDIRTWTPGEEHRLHFLRGRLESEISVTRTADGRDLRHNHGAEFRFLPNGQFLSSTTFDFGKLERRLLELSVMNGNLDVRIEDLR